MTRSPYAPLYLPGALLALVLVVSAIAVGYADSMVDDAERALDMKRQTLSTAQKKHANAGVEKDILQRFRETYAALEKIGFVGAEQRINWVDSLRVANRESNLFGVEYQIGQQESFPGATDLGVGDLAMRQSIMRVKFPLLHEGDLMPFFRNLAQQRSGVFVMNACELTRLPANGGGQAQPNLNAECELAWITVADPRSEGGSTP